MSLYTNDEWLESSKFPFCSTLYSFYECEIKEPHSHEFIEIAYIANGSGTHDYRGHRYPISTGDVLVIEPNIRINPIKTSICTFIMSLCSPPYFPMN
jgi:mannose-6-phosphate isomerase-like protein (cupin superfamily)